MELKRLCDEISTSLSPDKGLTFFLFAHFPVGPFSRLAHFPKMPGWDRFSRIPVGRFARLPGWPCPVGARLLAGSQFLFIFYLHVYMNRFYPFMFSVASYSF